VKTRGIGYKAGYKYQYTDPYYPVMLSKAPGDSIFDYNRNVTIHPNDQPWDREYIQCGPFLKLWPNGKMRILEGYAWDGPSGPAFDTDNFMTPSMVHDSLYQLMRNKVLPVDPFKKVADELMYTMCRRRGMCAPRAWWCRRGVQKFALKAATEKRKIHTAP